METVIFLDLKNLCHIINQFAGARSQSFFAINKSFGNDI